MRETLATREAREAGGKGAGPEVGAVGGGGRCSHTGLRGRGPGSCVPPRTSALLGAETTSDAGGGPQRPFSRGCTPSVTLPMSSPYRALTSAPRGPAAARPLATRLRHRGSPGSPDQKMPGTEDRTSE